MVVESKAFCGACYHDGKGAKRDYTKAVSYYVEAAKQRDSWAQYCLGLCYRDGEGVRKNTSVARKWLKISSDHGEKQAAKELRKLIA